MAGSGWGPPRLDGFILTERLGSGTYATVYKAYAKVGVGSRPEGPLCPPTRDTRGSVRARGLPSPRLTLGAGGSSSLPVLGLQNKHK